MSRFINLGQKKISIKLLGNDISDYCILLACGNMDNCAPYTEGACKRDIKLVRDLQKYIFLLTDVSLPIVYDNSNTVFEKEIRIGKTKRTVTSGENLGDEGYIIKTVGEHLEIVGGLRGLSYGVYSFIEKYFGVRYFTPVVEKILDQGDLKIGEIDEKFIPYMEYRDVMFPETWDKTFSVKQKINGLFCRPLGEEEGYGVGYAGGFDGICHTFWPLVPKDKYFKDHPEYFALVNGKRNPDGLCMSNEGTFNVLVKNLKKWLRAEKEPRLVSVSANDNNFYCQCPKCSEIDEREDSHAGQVLDFVNRVADAIKDEFPKVKIDMMSYSFTRKAPKYLKPRDNVAVRVCTGISCSNHGIEDCTEEVAVWNGVKGFGTSNFIRDINAWSAVSDKIYIWDYVIDFFHLSAIFPNFHTFLPRMRFYVEHNAKGIYFEGSTNSGEFYELRAYLHAKTAWNPFMSDEEFYGHLNDFLEGYYGNGAKYISEFIDYTSDYLKNMHFGPFSPLRFIFPSETKNGKTVYALDFFAKCRDIFAKAEQAADSSGDKERIKKSSIQVDYCDLFLNMDYYMSVADDKEKQMIIARNKSLYEKMIKYGAVRLLENSEILKITDFTLPPYCWSIDHKEQSDIVGIL